MKIEALVIPLVLMCWKKISVGLVGYAALTYSLVDGEIGLGKGAQTHLSDEPYKYWILFIITFLFFSFALADGLRQQES